MNIEKAQKDFNKLIEENGFTVACQTKDTGITVYHRIWTRKVEVAWYGEMEETLEARIMLSEKYPLVSIKRNGRQDPKFIRDYTSPKRAMNAIRQSVTFAGFEW